MKETKKWLTACLAGMMAVSLTGCGGPAGTEGTNGQGAGADGAGSTGNGDAVVMGRYVESSQPLDIGEVTDLVMLEDGRLALLKTGRKDAIFPRTAARPGRRTSCRDGKVW